jgi:glycosyltransferase domain-containing protein|tara:strand:+ start:1108 stop:2154 length:1047 start_codon:yes stop_codon:yes gene_type:complete
VQKILNKLTIILPIFSRHEFSHRFLDYLVKIDYQNPIILADGIDDMVSQSIIKKYKFLNISSIAYRQKVDFIDYYQMILSAIKNVKTEYVMLADNDDFFIESSLREIIIYLDKNSDYVSMGAEIIQFQIDNYSDKTYGKNISFNKRYDYCRTEEPFADLNGNIESIFKTFQPNFYNVFRAKAYLKIWEEIVHENFSDPTIMEFYIMLRVLSLGKQKTLLNCTHYIRQSGPGNSENYDFFNSLLKYNLPNDFRKLINAVNHNNSQDLSVEIKEGYSDYVKNFLLPRLKARNKSIFQILYNSIVDIYPFTVLKFQIKELLIRKKFRNSDIHRNNEHLKEINRIKVFLKSI